MRNHSRLPLSVFCLSVLLAALPAQAQKQALPPDTASADTASADAAPADPGSTEAATADDSGGDAAATGEAANDEAAEAQRRMMAAFDALAWKQGPATANVGTNATIRVPDGFRFLGGPDVKKFQEMMQNPSSGDEYVLAPNDLRWFALFEYDDTGYVKDDEKIDAAALLKSLKEGTEAANEERAKRGWSAFHVKGWRVQPAYNQTSKRLEWAIDGESDGGVTTNLFTKLLGRHGVTSVVLVSDPESLEANATEFRQAIEGYEFNAGERYAEFREGDKIAEYGLAGLIAGGTIAVAAKSGLLKGLFKFIALGAAALVASAKSLIAKFKKA